MTGATNAELARRAFGAANRQPKPDYEVVNALYHPDHEFVAQLTDVEGTTFRGAQGFREWLTRHSKLGRGSSETTSESGISNLPLRVAQRRW